MSTDTETKVEEVAQGTPKRRKTGEGFAIFEAMPTGQYKMTNGGGFENKAECLRYIRDNAGGLNGKTLLIVSIRQRVKVETKTETKVSLGAV